MYPLVQGLMGLLMLFVAGVSAAQELTQAGISAACQGIGPAGTSPGALVVAAGSPAVPTIDEIRSSAQFLAEQVANSGLAAPGVRFMQARTHCSAAMSELSPA